MVDLYHVSTWPLLASLGPGAEFTLHPGPQGAEGRGVYFAEGCPRLSAADAVAAGNPPVAIVHIRAAGPEGWWRTKAGLARKFGRPRTWHSDGKSVRCRVIAVGEGEGNLPLLHCEWSWES